MIVDTSALVTIVNDEPEAGQYLDILLRAPVRRISAGNLFETYLVIDGARNPASSIRLHELLLDLRLLVEPVTESQVIIARVAYGTYGRGTGHGARLNYGDCFAYALAKERDEPLLFKGNDSSQTDITAAI